MKNQYALIPFPNLHHPNVKIFSEVIIDHAFMTLLYTVQGDLNDLIIPHFDRLKEGRDLWKSTCMECFLLLENRKSYIELNFSPTGSWYVYYFDEYRKPSENLNHLVCMQSIEVSQNQDIFTLKAQLHLNDLHTQALGMSAVIEDKKNQLAYFSLKHLSNQPDFHQSGSYAHFAY